MLVLKAQTCFETQRFFYGLEKKKKLFSREYDKSHWARTLE